MAMYFLKWLVGFVVATFLAGMVYSYAYRKQQPDSDTLRRDVETITILSALWPLSIGLLGLLMITYIGREIIAKNLIEFGFKIADKVQSKTSKNEKDTK
jgi:hypothetical protein